MPGEDADEPALVMVNLAVRVTAKEMLMEFFFSRESFDQVCADGVGLR
jgi:hypothetical protein